MHKSLSTGILLAFGILIICMISGCTDDDPTEHDDIKLVAIVPEDGGIVSAAGQLKMTFDGFPKSVYVDGKPAIIQDITAIVEIRDLPNIILGAENTVTVAWRNRDNFVAGSKTITFYVLKPVTVIVAPSPYINHGQELTLRFSTGVLEAKLNGRAAEGAGRDWRVSSEHLPQGEAEFLNVEWINHDGSAEARRVGPYFVGHIDFDPPEIRSGTVSDGDADVDPVPINAGGFRYDFNHHVTGTIKLTDEAGADLNWIGIVVGQTATLTPAAGQELVNETTYKVEINVRDGRGNSLQTTITFVTKPK